MQTSLDQAFQSGGSRVQTKPRHVTRHEPYFHVSVNVHGCNKNKGLKKASVTRIYVESNRIANNQSALIGNIFWFVGRSNTDRHISATVGMITDYCVARKVLVVKSTINTRSPALNSHRAHRSYVGVQTREHLLAVHQMPLWDYLRRV